MRACARRRPPHPAPGVGTGNPQAPGPREDTRPSRTCTGRAPSVRRRKCPWEPPIAGATLGPPASCILLGSNPSRMASTSAKEEAAAAPDRPSPRPPAPAPRPGGMVRRGPSSARTSPGPSATLPRRCSSSGGRWSCRGRTSYHLLMARPLSVAVRRSAQASRTKAAMAGTTHFTPSRPPLEPRHLRPR